MKPVSYCDIIVIVSKETDFLKGETMEKYHFQVHNYQKQKPFSSFLSGIAGKNGIPLWAFYVNRGQLIASFGVKNKNGALMEFFPANAAYHYVSKIGFRTFIKIDQKVLECFKEDDLGQTLDVYEDKVSITQHFDAEEISIKVTYYTLPNERLAALNRKVQIINHSKVEKSIEIVDGLAQMLPTGIDYGGYKAVSNLLQSWMETKPTNQYVFYTLRGSTGDDAEVSMLTEGHFMHTISDEPGYYIYDYKALFDEDTSLETPYHLIDHTLKDQKQVRVNQVPSAMIYFTYKLKPNTNKTFTSMFGYVEHEDKLISLTKKTSQAYIQNKEEENEDIHQSLTSVMDTKTKYPIFDAYLKQCYLDNVLRGGYPIQFKTKSKDASYYIYSRKHGDLERDYNFFNLEPAYYSQGNGNFRDVLQNRRNDLFFFPEIKSFNILMFASFIQDDGYNPLSIEGIEFKFDGNINDYDISLKEFLDKPYTPGSLLMKLEDLNLEEAFEKIILQSDIMYKASFGEGYWEDHFTYLYDLIESYQHIYPDQIDDLLFKSYVSFFQSNAYVLPRNEKYVYTKKQTVRQYGAIKHLEERPQWLMVNGELIKVPLISKLMTLVVNKFAHLDPFGIGLSYEANKPGWNDACNGLPGLFGSGISEMIELIRLLGFVKHITETHKNHEIEMLDDTYQFIRELDKINQDDAFHAWDQRMNALESYRKKRLHLSGHLIKVKLEELYSLIQKMDDTLNQALHKAEKLADIIPTYLTFEAIDYEKIKDTQGLDVIGEYGLPLVKVKKFTMRPLPPFLEGPARYLKITQSTKDAKTLYQAVKKSELYDRKHKFYQTSVSLESESFEIGRLKAFTPGWLERESNFLHMTYKYLLGLLKSGLYNEFYEEMKTNLTCFMDPKVYGRSPLENSSFIATSSNPDPKKHGQGFVARLSGSTAEALSMAQLMFYGKDLFTYKDDELIFKPKPILHRDFFLDGKVETKLFGSTHVVYHNPDMINTYDQDAKIKKIVLRTKDEEIISNQSFVSGNWAKHIRNKDVLEIYVYYNKEENR